MWTHLGRGGGLVLMVAAGSGAPALGQSSMVANRADTGVILRPADGERVAAVSGRPYHAAQNRADAHELSGALHRRGGDAAGTAIPLHRHERHEEALYLHRGQVTVTLGTRRVVAEAGTFVYIPAATWIGVENSGRETASVVGIFAEGAVEPCFRRLVQRPSPADSVRLEQHCGMTFKGKAR